MWRWLAWLLLGLGALAFALLGPLDSSGRNGDLTAHVAQHLLLGDVVAALLLLGLPPGLRTRMRSMTERLQRQAIARGVLSPIGAVTIWAAVTTAWYVPAVHRAAAPGGPIHLLDHASFVVVGLLVWLAVFDFRAPQDFRTGLRYGGMPWWARHAYAMGSRTLMVPAALIVWFAPGYGSADQVSAASLLVGVEMFLFVGAMIAGFTALAITEGRREREAG